MLIKARKCKRDCLTRIKVGIAIYQSKLFSRAMVANHKNENFIKGIGIGYSNTHLNSCETVPLILNGSATSTVTYRISTYLGTYGSTDVK